MLDCLRPCTPQGPDAKDCFHSQEGGPFLPAENSKLLELGGGDPATPCEHLPAAQTCGIKGCFFLLLPSLGKGSSPGPRREALCSLCLQRSAPSLPLSLPMFALPRQGQMECPHPPRAWLVRLLEACSLGDGKNAGLMSSGMTGLLFGNFLLLRALAPRIP